MLQSFRATVDRGGIRTLRLERDDDCLRPTNMATAEIWVVLNDQELPVIRETIRSGNRIRALRLLSDRAVSLGSILPD